MEWGVPQRTFPVGRCRTLHRPARGPSTPIAAVPCAGVCGICGLLSPAVAGPAEAAAVRAAADAIRHRGPDHGIVAQWGPCTLGNRRLRVIDLATGDQPVANEDGSIVAVFNGEIYNFRTLRAELEEQGHRLTGTGDTPAIPHLYEQHGERFVERLDGMFALALWDAGRAAARARARPLRQEAAPLDAPARRHTRVRVGVEGAARLPGRATGGRASSGSTPISRSATCPATRRRSRGSTASRPAASSSPRADRCGSSATGSSRPAPRSPAARRVARGGPRRGARGRAQAPRRGRPARRPALGRDRLERRRRGHGAGEPEPVRTFSVGFTDARYDERRYARTRRRALRHDPRGDRPRARRRGAAPAARRRVRRAVRRTRPRFRPSSSASTPAASSPSRSPGTAATRSSAATSATERTPWPARLDRVPRAATATAARALRLIPTARSEPRSAAFRAARFLDTAGLDPAERYGQPDGDVPAAAPVAAVDATRRSREIGELPTAGDAARPPARRRDHGLPAPRRRDLPARRPALQGRHRLDGALARVAGAAPRPRPGRARTRAAGRAQAAGIDG